MSDSEELNLSPIKPYQILGVDPDDSLQTIKRKFGKEIMKYHPDKYDGELSQKERDILEKHCRKLIRSYKIIKRDKSSGDFFSLKNADRSEISIPESYPIREEIVDKTNRFKSVDDYLDFKVPKHKRRHMDSRDFHSAFEKEKKEESTSSAIVLRTSDGFTGYNVDQFQTFAKNVDGENLINENEILFDFGH
jgi:curved DNA-binding protein CbpA